MIRTRQLAGLALASTLLLTGCGASGWNPGVAVRVDDDTISLPDMQDTTTAYCSAVETQLEEGTSVANSVVAAQVASSLALRSAAEQWAELEGLEPGEDYDTQADSLETAIAGLSDEQQEAVRDVNLAQPYLASVELAYGKKQATGSDDDASKAGQKAFADWLDGQDVRVDPRYGVSVSNGALAKADTQVSYPVSETAKSVASGEADDTYAAGLPDSQRCGG